MNHRQAADVFSRAGNAKFASRQVNRKYRAFLSLLQVGWGTPKPGASARKEAAALGESAPSVERAGDRLLTLAVLRSELGWADNWAPTPTPSQT